MITVFYDGKCDICAREIRYYRRIAPPGAVNWVDITRSPEAFQERGYRVSDGLRLLHAEDQDGRMHQGVDAFALIWRRLRYWGVLAWFVSLPGVRQLARAAYRRFADRRFQRLGHCQLALDEDLGAR